MANYVYVQIINNNIYDMYGGEPHNLAFTLTEEEAKHFFKDSYVRMEIHQLTLPKKTKKK